MRCDMKRIDGDALIEKAHHEAKGMKKSYEDFGVLVEWLVDKTPTIEPEQRWIPCSERLPDTPVRVQICLDNGWIVTGYYKDGEWFTVPDLGTELLPSNVLAWMSLSEPYREEGEQE